METRAKIKRKAPMGRKRRSTNRQSNTMDDRQNESRNVADGNEAGDQNMTTALLVSPKIENESRSAAACSGIEDQDMAAADNSAIENENRDIFDDFLSHNSFSASSYRGMDDTSTERILEEADILLAEFRGIESSRNEIMNGIMKPDEPVASTSGNTQNSNSIQAEALPLSDDSNSVTLVDAPDIAEAAAVPTNAVDESVVIVHDDGVLPQPMSQGSDDDIILIEDGPDVRVQRITAVVDLCSPESSSSNRRKRHHSPSPMQRPPDLSESMDETMPVRTVKCPVCMEKIKNGPPQSTICGHIFCGDCIKRAIKARKKCPICNTGLTLKGIHPLYFS